MTILPLETNTANLQNDASRVQPITTTGDVGTPGNVTNKFREAFEVYDKTRWLESARASGDIVAIDGNAAAASYLVISKDPLAPNQSTTIETAARFFLPIDLAIGLSLSQRTLGQEFAVELVTDEPTTPIADDLAIASISQATTTLTVNTTLPHGLKAGMRIGIRDCADSRFNYPALVVATTPSDTQFTATAGPAGNIPSVTAGPFTSGYVVRRSSLGYAPNGTSMIFENASATNASFYVRSEAGDVLPSGTITGNHSATLNSTASVQAINAALNYAFQPTSEYRLTVLVDGIQWSDINVDATGQASNRYKRTQVVPDITVPYKLRFRCTNNASLPVPVAEIVSVSKPGTTTATVITDVPHNLTTGDYITAFGVRDTSAFANLATAVVASVVNANTFTVVWGSAVTATSYGGFVARTQGGQAIQGVLAQVIQSAAVASGILTLTGSAAWSGVLIGDYVNAHGVRNAVNGADMGLDGSYRVRDIQGTSLFLEAIGNRTVPADLASTNCGGAVIKRTDLRISFVRILDFERMRVEMAPRPAGDASLAAPVVVQGGSVTASQSNASSLKAQVEGTMPIDSAFPAPVGVGARAANANPNAMSTNADLVALLATMIGAVVQKPYAIPEAGWNASLALTSTTATALMGAAGAGLKRYVTAMQVINTGGSAVDLILLDGATERWRLPLPANIPVSITLPTELQVTANTALNVNLSAAGTVRVNAQGYTAP